MVKTKMWSDSWFVTLSEKAQLLFVYFISNEHTRISGFYELPLFKITSQFGWNSAEVTKLLKELHPKIIYHAGWVIIPKYQEHQNVTNNPKVQASIEKELKSVPDDVLNLKSEIINHKSEGIDTISIGYKNKENGSTKPNVEVGTNSAKSVDSVKSTSSLYNDPNFEMFWDVYPKKVGKGEAWKSWKKLNPSLSLGEKIISTTLLYVQTPQWKKDNGQYIPNPATFLNQRRFDDEPKVGTTSNNKYGGL